MKRYVIRRLMMAVPLLLAISFICFLFINLIPSNPAEVALKGTANACDNRRGHCQDGGNAWSE